MRRTRRRVGIGATASVLALVAGLIPGEQAAAQASSPGTLTTIATPARAAQHTMITLITGDRVDYAKDGSGHETATLIPDPANGAVEYRSFGGPDGDFVIPLTALPFISSGALDKELFDVRYLAANGYGDAAMASLPLILRYTTAVPAGAMSARAAALPGARPGHSLESLHAESVSLGKASAHAFWSTLSAAGGVPSLRLAPHARLGGNVAEVMLDRKVRASLSDSVPLIGAPVAWAAGYDGTGVKIAVLDTGYDPTHPDLAGQVADSKNFTPDPSVVDGFGHGTHCASIIAGTGAASGGLRKGVAPGARLLVGKVLDNSGSGFDSWIIDGMEWAAASGAKVASMSLGGQVTDGTDPLAQAVNDITESSGMLFVIAAGNSGPGPTTVGSPGSANDALTVGATSKTDTLADFSSRGPRLGDDAIKPEITAPGVNIIAARAAGTALGPVVDNFYTSLSGTSMATPHVAGAAAILAELHPDWTAPMLKAALIASSKDNGFTVWQQGAGRVDVARAIQQNILASPAVISAGPFSDPYTGQTTTRDITYSNVSDTAVTLSVSASLKDRTGADAPAGMLTFQDTTLTVPAHGTATTKVTIEPTFDTPGAYSGRIVATDPAGHATVVPVGFVKGPKVHKLTLRIEFPSEARNGQALTSPYGLTRVDDLADGPQTFTWPGSWSVVDDPHSYVLESTASIPEGIYDVFGEVLWNPGPSLPNHDVITPNPEVKVTSDSTVTFRVADAVPVRVQLPGDTEEHNRNWSVTRTTQSGITYFSGSGGSGPPSPYWYPGTLGPLSILPTVPPTIGAFKFTHDHIIGAPQATLRLTGKGSVDLRPVYPTADSTLPKFPAGTTNLTVASRADLDAGRNIRGKLVFVDTIGETVIPMVQAAVDAGAAGLLLLSDHDPTELLADLYRPLAKIPVLWVSRFGAEAAKVRSVLSGGSTPTARIQGQPVTPFEYKLRFYELGHIPGKMVYPVDVRKLTRIDTEYHSESAGRPNGPDVGEVDFGFRPEDLFEFAVSNGFNAPTRRVEYYNVTGPDVAWWRQYDFQSGDEVTGFSFRFADSIRGFTTRTSEREQWNAPFPVVGNRRPGPQFPGSAQGFPFACALCRQGDRLYPIVGTVAANDPSHTVNSPGVTFIGLSVDGQDLALQPGLIPYFAMPTGAGHYDLVTDYQDGYDGQKLAKDVRTEWTFTSPGTPTANAVTFPPYLCAGFFISDHNPCVWLPLIYPSLDLPLDLRNTTPAGKKFTFTAAATPAAPSGGPAIAGLTVSTSFDDGKTWVPASVRADGHGVFDVSVVHPALGNTTGAVSLRVEAWDVDGNRVVQTIPRAYGLS